MTNKRTIQKEQTRVKILDTAYALFSREGFVVVSTSAISKAAKISHGSIFAHFPTRDELIVAVISRFGAEMATRIHDLTEARYSLRTILEAHLECLKENELFYARLIQDLCVLPQQVGLHVIAIQSAVSHHINNAAEQEIRDGKILPIAADLLFNTWIGLVHHYVTNRKMFVTSGSVIETHGEKLLNHFINLISQKNEEV